MIWLRYAFIIYSYFNSRPSARGDIRPDQKNPAASRFQFTPLREGRHDVQDVRIASVHFNSRPSARGDGCLWMGSSMGHVISIHAPPRGATRNDAGNSRGHEYFNSRPSARGDEQSQLRFQTNCISIHAPPRGATWNARKALISAQYISIHAPPRGATRNADADALDTDLFQFTPLREGRRLQCRTAGGHIYFNSRPSARGDMSVIKAKRSEGNFNSRPSARGDAVLQNGQKPA